MSVSTTGHSWLRRISDYQSGGVSDAERTAAEAHLAICQECQEALAMYRRFYSLLRLPLRLGPPSAHFGEETIAFGSAPRPPADRRPPQRSQRSRMLGVAAAVLAATLVIAGFLAVYATRSGYPSGVSTPTTHPAFPTVTPRRAPTATETAEPTTATTQPGAFVCANPPGSNLSYAYQRGDGRAYVVTGCAAPVLIPVSTPTSMPLSWSPRNRYLAVSACQADVDNTCSLVLYEPGSGKILTTKYIGDYPYTISSQIPDGHLFRFFIGWVDDNTFLGALQPVTTSNPNGPPLGTSTIVKVDVASGAETPVGKVAWFAGTKIIAPGYLFYGGLKTMSEGQAHLHRLNLSTGADTQLVSLGEYGNGGCQVTIFCNWTAPWDVSPDGLHVVYHNPGPTTFSSETSNVKDTPLVYSGIDGTNPSKPFGNRLAGSLTAPYFSPDGAYLIDSGLGDPQQPADSSGTAILQPGGSVTYLHGNVQTVRPENLAVIYYDVDTNKIVLYGLAQHSKTTLEQYAMFYHWTT